MCVSVGLLRLYITALVTQGVFLNVRTIAEKKEELKCTRLDQIENLNRNFTFVLIGFMQLLNSIPSQYKVLGLVLSEAMKFAVREANQNLLPPNVQFSYIIYDNCGDQNLEISSEIVLRMILDDPWTDHSSDINELLHTLDISHNLSQSSVSSSNNICDCEHNKKNVPVAIIGPPTSASGKHIGKLISVLSVPMISYLATSTELNDRTLYPNFYRTIPTDNLISHVILDILKRYNWTYVSIVSSDNSYGINGRLELLESFKLHNICTDIDELVAIPYNKSQVRDVVQKLTRWRMTQVAIFFGTEDSIELFFRVAAEEKLYGITWILPDVAEIGQWYPNMDINVVKGALGIIHFPGEYKAFAEYFWNLSAVHHGQHDSFLKDYFDKHTNVTNLSEKKETLKAAMNYAGYVRNGVVAYVQAFKNYLQDNTECLNRPWDSCNVTTFNRTLFVDKYVKNVKFKGLANETVSFDEFGVVKSYSFQIINIKVLNNGQSKVENIGSWSSTHKLFIDKLPYWGSKNQQHPNSQCSEECQPGNYPIFQFDKSCCWICISCKEGTYKDTHGNHKCKVCPDGKSTGNRTSCVTMTMIGPATFVWNKYILIPLCVFGSILSLVYLITWITFRYTPIVKSSNFRLSAIQLSVQMMSFLTVASMFSIELSTALCVSRMIIVGTETVVAISLLIMKSQQLLRVFQSKVKITKRHIFVTNSIGYVMLFSTIFIELTMAGGIFLTQNVGVGVKYYENIAKEKHCIVPYMVPAQIGYIVVLIFICAVQAFRSRNLPSKFNEARSILYSIFVSFICMSTMTLLTMNSRTHTEGDFFMAFCIAFSCLAVLVIMYGQKTWNLWFHKSKHTINAYRKSLYNSAIDCANRKIHLMELEENNENQHAVDSQ